MSKNNKSGVSQKGQVVVLGIDLSKNSFQLHGVDARGNVTIKKKLNRKALLPFIANLPECVIAIEACGGSHYWCRKFMELGHNVHIIAPQFVKPYVKSNKNDAADAEAICEAAQRPNMRFVPFKNVEQQDIQCIHRIRSQAVARRTALGNQIRGLLMEYGVIIPKGISFIRRQIPLVLEDAENGLTVLFRELLSGLYEEMAHLDERIETLELKLQTTAANSEACQLLLTIPGIGLLSATALFAAIGDISAFKNGRELAAWLGLVPKQQSTGGKPTLLGISKRGDTYLRTLLIHGGRTVVRVADKYDDRRNNWIKEIDKRRGKNISAVAVANKNARIAWAVLTKKEPYKAAA